MIKSGETAVLLCRAGFEDALSEEVSRNRRANAESSSRRSGLPGASAEDSLPRGTQPDAGWIVLDGRLGLRPAPFIFERQRLPRARWTPAPAPGARDGAAQAALVAALVALWQAPLAAHHGPWTLHAFAPNPDAGDSLTAAAQGLGRAVRDALCAGLPSDGLLSNSLPSHSLPCNGLQPGVEHAGRPHPPQGAGSRRSRLAPATLEPEAAARQGSAGPGGNLAVLQLCRVPGGIWSSFGPFAELSDPWPGGVHRMPEDPAAPSRSYLKLEEALDVMGIQPRAGERVVDLGAAPGGWSWAFVKRGCDVIAVDNGPLKLKSLGEWGGELTHLREDGLRFRPARPVDWLASDMLIAPGQALGLVRKWHEAGWAMRFIVNFKIPQQQPYAALAPICAALDGLRGFRYRLRQLYHDRREVTLMGESLTPPAQHAASAPRGKNAPRPARARPGLPARQSRTAHPRRKGRR